MPEGTTENHRQTKVHTVPPWAVTPNHIASHPKRLTPSATLVRASERARNRNSVRERSQLKEVNIKKITSNDGAFGYLNPATHRVLSDISEEFAAAIFRVTIWFGQKVQHGVTNQKTVI
jgi:hypothetical protein